MDIVGNRQFVEIPGTATLELPPLLVSEGSDTKRMDRVVDMASQVIEREDLVPSMPLDALASETDVERRKMDMALNLVDQYMRLRRHWHWGAGILEWIRQCEITFESKPALRTILRPDVWPHAGRSSFVRLLEDKGVVTEGIEVERAVGLRLTYRHLPPLLDFSDQFLFYLNGRLAGAAYETWARLSPDPISSLPPERFSVHVHTM
ncbi:MAG: hypothetical protein R2729_11970 [Bryobacteraceae bacterium]